MGEYDTSNYLKLTSYFTCSAYTYCTSARYKAKDKLFSAMKLGKQKADAQTSKNFKK